MIIEDKTKMVIFKKNVSGIVLLLLALCTILNKYYVVDFETKWTVAMFFMASVLFTYSFYTYNRRKTPINLLVVVIFAIELIAVILGFNLDTQFYPELIQGLYVLGLFLIIKRWLK